MPRLRRGGSIVAFLVFPAVKALTRTWPGRWSGLVAARAALTAWLFS